MDTSILSRFTDEELLHAVHDREYLIYIANLESPDLPPLCAHEDNTMNNLTIEQLKRAMYE